MANPAALCTVGRGPIRSELRTDQDGQVDEAVGVAPLVVVPGDDLDLVADHLGQARVEDGRVRIGLDVLGDDRVLGVGDHRRVGLGGLLHGGVDLLDGGLAAGLEREVDDRTGRGRHAQGVAVELALELRQHQGHGLGGTGLGRDDVEGRGAGATQVLVRTVLQVLVGGVGVDGRHQALDDAELVVQHLGDRGEAVRGARRVGDDVVLLRVVLGVVHADHDGLVLVLRRGGDDDLLGAGLDVGLGLGGVGEAAGRLDHDVRADLAPRQRRRILLRVGHDLVAVDREGLLVVRDLAVEAAEDRVVLEQVGEGVVVGQVVDADDLDISAGGDQGSVEVTADAAETVDANLDGHVCVS
ncbi:hypothetical protein SDC9_77237 [bioreactor metagenome]|uniref:NAD-specific glutamate dehydrogenase n=1 Tax=bioreactor metagenome TaxID=1076179 RepID=A0A644YQY3_9ZZZZ